MCFSYTLNTSGDQLENRYGLGHTEHKFDPVYFVSGFTFPKMPVIKNTNKESLDLFNWGLIPNWIKDGQKANEIKKFTLNARSETIFEKPSFKQSILKRRCLIPATGFFEWQHRKNEKIPYYIFLKEKKIFSFAGIWDTYINKNDQIINSYSLITCDANPFMANIHNSKKRMPVILNEDEEKMWINEDITSDEISQIMKPKEYNMDAYTINKSISNPKINSNTPEIYKEWNYNENTLGF